MITLNDINLFLRVPVSPVFINALVLFNGKLLPTFVNHTISKLVCYQNIEANIGTFRSISNVQCYNHCKTGFDAKKCLPMFASNKGADNTAHVRSLISAVVIRLMESIKS